MRAMDMIKKLNGQIKNEKLTSTLENMHWRIIFFQYVKNKNKKSIASQKKLRMIEMKFLMMLKYYKS